MNPKVHHFASAIEVAMDRNARKPGDSYEHLLGRVSDKLFDLRGAVHVGDANRILEEAANVAVFLLFVADAKGELSAPDAESHSPKSDGLGLQAPKKSDDVTSWDLAEEMMDHRPTGKELRIQYYVDLIEEDIASHEEPTKWSDLTDLPLEYAQRLDAYTARRRAKRMTRMTNFDPSILLEEDSP